MKPITDYALEYGIYDSYCLHAEGCLYNYSGTNIPVYNW